MILKNKTAGFQLSTKITPSKICTHTVCIGIAKPSIYSTQTYIFGNILIKGM